MTDHKHATARRRLLPVVAASLAALVAYLAFWPVPVRPVAWSAPAAPGYVGVHAVNSGLVGLHMIDLGGEEGPEHVVLGPDGRLYVAVASGRILRMAPDGADRQVLADTGGRVLGFAFDAAGNLIAADAYRGLVEVTPDGRLRLLTARVDGDPIRYANSVVVAASGLVYFTDSSRRFSPVEVGGTFEASLPDILEQSATGRVLAYDPARGTTRPSPAAWRSPTASPWRPTSGGSWSPKRAATASGRFAPTPPTSISPRPRPTKPQSSSTTCPATPTT